MRDWKTEDTTKSGGQETAVPPVVPERQREIIAKIFRIVEDIVYIGLGLLLAGSAVVLLGFELVDFVRLVAAGRLDATVVALLDRILLILMIIEIMYTVQISFRRHPLVPEPFLVVGLIAATRRVLVLTAEFANSTERGEAFVQNAMMELALLTLLIVVLVVSLRLLRQQQFSVGSLPEKAPDS
jgi:hypothetical protein